MKNNFLFSSRKSFRSNLLIVISMMLSLTVVLTITTIIVANRSIQAQTTQQEKQNLSTLSDRYTNYLDQISLINTSFALSKIDFEGTWEEKDLYAYNSVDYQSTLCMTMYAFIQGMRITNQSCEISKGSLLLPNEAQSTHLYDIRSSNLLMLKGSGPIPHSLCLYQKCLTDDPYSNEVLMNINCFEFGRNIMNSYSDLEKEFIIYGDGTILISNRSDLLGKNIFTEFGMPENTLRKGSMHMQAIKDGLSCSTMRIGDTPLYVIRIFDKALYRSFYTAVWSMIGVFDLIILVIFLCTSYFVTKFTYRPVQQIIKSVSDYYPLPILKNFDEVNYIRDTLKQLNRRNISLNKSNQDNLIALQQQQMLAMQAQISPHFMFNMLDTVSWLSIDLLEENNPIEKILKSICSILKYSMDLTTSFATIREELQIAQDCIHILEIRYDVNIHFEYEVEPKLMEFKMLKLCFEPIIENTILHGFANKRSNGTIRIKIYMVQPDMLKIEIIDNGMGIRPGNLEQITEQLQQYNKTDAKHIGLKNVNCRLHLLYGEHYSFKIESTYEQGTTCHIQIPLIEF